ncbi:hypothetical protein H257_03193 [Aphanomyces astaci]|uniref:Uncharacterized protein n=1 Tax=Aphanomyces astaci TaxID=112090 RepID=W4H0L8_APHAT|nr:hypothetical protein H257_03193 [Aphanomyces astaci]ETV85457.1 hypothetical protein H257_03193 [Aphanomyces astaci]|eukprot:XP_009825475.1 hypothetical protein H257_03193 [Aphanomyces astaci]
MAPFKRHLRDLWLEEELIEALSYTASGTFGAILA